MNSTGNRAYVANSGSNNVSVIDLESAVRFAPSEPAKVPGLAKISPDGATLVGTNRIGGSVSIIDANSFRIRGVFPGRPQATDAAILPDSSKVSVACSAGRQVMAVGFARPQSAIATDLSIAFSLSSTCQCPCISPSSPTEAKFHLYLP